MGTARRRLDGISVARTLPEKDGVYRLVVTAFQGKGSGPYTLIIREFQDQPGPRNPEADPKTPPKKEDTAKEKSKG